MLERFSISLEDDLLKRFDLHLKEHTYGNRSEAIRDLIRQALVEHEWDSDDHVVGVITLVYDHHRRQLQDRLTEIQHSFHHAIVSTTHIHLDHDHCLEVIIARDRASTVRSLADRLRALRGVKNAALSMSSTGQHLH